MLIRCSPFVDTLNPDIKQAIATWMTYVQSSPDSLQEHVIIIHFTGWNIVDAILSIGISIYILRSAIRLIKSAGIILMDSAPRGITSEHIEEVLCAIHGINGVHDIHIWEIHPGDISISAHIITDLEHHSQLLEEARNTLIEHFHTKHITLQVENAEFAKDHGCDHCSSREE